MVTSYRNRVVAFYSRFLQVLWFDAGSNLYERPPSWQRFQRELAQAGLNTIAFIIAQAAVIALSLP
jgi:hypothetical protein